MNNQQHQLIIALCGYIATRGGDPYAVCNTVEIDLGLLLKQTHPSVSSEQIHGLWNAAASHCEDELFGLHLGESLQLSALGAVGEIIKSSASIGEAMTIATSLVPLITDLFTVHLSNAEESVCLNITRTAAPAPENVARHVADFLSVFAVYELNGFCMRRISPLSVEYPGQDKYKAELERVFRCSNITFSSRYALYFESSYLQLPIITANYDLQQSLLKKLGKPDTLSRTSVPFSAKVTHFLMDNSYLGMPTLEDVAANFNMTPRSFQRRLQEESVTFQQLVDAVRKSLALHYLDSGKYQIKEISTMLGYNELSAFSRAFKRWTGKPPINYTA